MGKAAITLILTCFLISCINHQTNEDGDEVSRFWPQPQTYQDSENDDYWKIEYAEGFDITADDDGLLIETFSLKGNEEWEDHIWLPHQTSEFSENYKVVQYPLNRIACQSSTYLAYLIKMNELELVTGLCGMEYVQDQEIIERLEENECQEICLGERVGLESLLSVNPELFLIYPFKNTDIEEYRENGIQTLMVAEYLEKHPLARLEWIKIFGVLTNQYDYSKSIYDHAKEEYNSNVTGPISEENQFILNLPYGDTWYAPSSSSLIVNLCQDAGLDYSFKDDGGTENVPHSKEEMWELGTTVPYWVVIANRPKGFDLTDLLAEEAVYREFRAVKEGKVIFCNTNTSDYFTYGVIEPHIMLNELKQALVGQPEENARYFKILK